MLTVETRAIIGNKVLFMVFHLHLYSLIPDRVVGLFHFDLSRIKKSFGLFNAFFIYKGNKSIKRILFGLLG